MCAADLRDLTRVSTSHSMNTTDGDHWRSRLPATRMSCALTMSLRVAQGSHPNPHKALDDVPLVPKLPSHSAGNCCNPTATQTVCRFAKKPHRSGVLHKPRRT